MATLDNNKKYLVHNIYGDAQTLIDTIGSNVAIPAGWSDAANANRVDYINSMNTVNATNGKPNVDCNCFPTVFFYRAAFNETVQKPDNAEAGGPDNWFVPHNEGWYQFPVESWLAKSDWTWTKINAEIQWMIDNNKFYCQANYE
tara:strand:- start:62 stop:493 length:432 start_codon:yes stop_codon:yes gene_type:complete